MRRGGRRGGTGAVLKLAPNQISGLVWWLRSDMGVTTASGDVSAWADQSGSGDSARNMTQGTSARRPAYNSSDSAYNNLPSIQFDGANTEYLNGGVWSTTYASPITMACVANWESGTAGAVFDNEGPTAGDEHSAIIDTGTGKVRSFFGPFGTVQSIGSNVSSGTPFIALTTVNGATASGSHIWVSSRNTQDTTTVNSSYSVTLGVAGMAIGRKIKNTAYMTGKVVEVAAWNRILTDSEIAKFMAYAGARYGITITG